MDEYKQMIKEYEGEKQRKKDEKKRRIKRMREKIIQSKKLKEKNKKKKKQGEYTFDPDDEDHPVLDESYHNIDSDPELRKLFNIKKKKRPKANLELQNNQASFLESSESELGENLSEEHGLSEESVRAALDHFADSFCDDEDAYRLGTEHSSKDSESRFVRTATERKLNMQDSILKSRLAVVSEFKDKTDDANLDNSQVGDDSKKQPKQLFTRNQNATPKQFRSRVFVTKQELQRQEREKKKHQEEVENAQKEADSVKDSKSKRGAALFSKRLFVDKRASSRTSRRSSVESRHSGYDGERSPVPLTPVSRTQLEEPRSDTPSQKNSARGKAGPHRKEEHTPASRLTDQAASPHYTKDKLETLTINYNGGNSAGSNQSKLNRDRVEGDTFGSRVEDQRKNPKRRVSISKEFTPTRIQEEEEQALPEPDASEVFNFTSKGKQSYDVEVISNINSSHHSRAHSQVVHDLNEVNDDILTLQAAPTHKTSETQKDDNRETHMQNLQPIAHQQLASTGSSHANNLPENASENNDQDQSNQIVEEAHADDELESEQGDVVHQKMAQTGQNFSTGQIPKVSVYEAAQAYIQSPTKLDQRPATSSAKTTLLNGTDMNAQSVGPTLNPKQQRVRKIRNQEAQSYKIRNKVFFNRGNQAEKLKASMQTLPKAPPKERYTRRPSLLRT